MIRVLRASLNGRIGLLWFTQTGMAGTRTTGQGRKTVLMSEAIMMGGGTIRIVGTVWHTSARDLKVCI